MYKTISKNCVRYLWINIPKSTKSTTIISRRLGYLLNDYSYLYLNNWLFIPKCLHPIGICNLRTLKPWIRILQDYKSSITSRDVQYYIFLEFDYYNRLGAAVVGGRPECHKQLFQQNYSSASLCFQKIRRHSDRAKLQNVWRKTGGHGDTATVRACARDLGITLVTPTTSYLSILFWITLIMFSRQEIEKDLVHK